MSPLLAMNDAFARAFRRGAQKRRRVRRLARLEGLEDRVMLTTFVVNTTADSTAVDGQLSLREAIEAADSNTIVGDAAAGASAGDVIQFDSELQGQTITLELGQLSISDDLVIDGGGLGIVIDGAEASGILSINTNEVVRINDLTFTNGLSADVGGGISTEGEGSVFLTNVAVTENAALGAGGAGIYNGVRILRIFDSTISGNLALGESGSGGGILNAVDAKVFVYDSTISGNTALAAGGGIEVEASNVANFSVRLEGVNLTGNSAGLVDELILAPGIGGGLHVAGDTNVSIRDSNVQGNTAALEGGGLWNGDGSMLVIDSTVDGNTALGGAGDDGGGGIFNNGGELVVTRTDVTNNAAAGVSGSGGGILSVNGLVGIRSSTISGNTASRAGGGIEIVDGTLFVSNSAIDGNTALSLDELAPGNGGGLHVTGAADIIMIHTAVTNNTATSEGGGLWNQAGATMNLRYMDISGNTANGVAADDGGGAVFNNGGMIEILDSTISGNTAAGAAGSGGAILSTDGNVLVLRAEVTGNTANRAGGAFEVIEGDFKVSNSLIDSNVAGPVGLAAPGNGGALHISGNTASVQVVRSTVSNNIAASEGGGLWNQSGSTLDVASTRLTGNASLGTDVDDGGGAIFNNGGNLIIRGSFIIENTAAARGGGVFLGTGGTASITRTLISGNVAATEGGGVYNDGQLTLIVRADIHENVAAAGGGIFTDANGTTTINGNSIINNDPDDLAGTGIIN